MPIPIVLTPTPALGQAARAVASPAATRTPGPDAHGFACLGKETAVGQAAGTVTIDAERASIGGQGALGDSLTATSDSVLTAFSRHAKTPVTFAGVSAGELLSARGDRFHGRGRAGLHHPPGRRLDASDP